MAGNNIRVNGQVDLSLNLSAENAKRELANLQKSLKAVSNIEIKTGPANQVGEIGKQIRDAANAAMQLQSHLTAATNVNTGNLDFSKFSQSLGRDGKQLAAYRDALVALGPQGKSAFLGLANSIAKSEIPLRRTNTLLNNAWDNLKRTAGWQLSSSIIHGLIGNMQQAVGYAKDLNNSLNDIRIVTGASSDQMAKFALEANKAAKNLSTSTTEYTKASLIYYQQGLNDAEVKQRTETTIKMANVTGTTAQKVSEQMTAVWNNYDNGTKSLQYYADAMAALGAATASSTDEIAQGLQKFASISQTVGLSYEYATAALATVTATSRESADVVGNAFKTLFARIQGLQLGETLEDGTDLNKYSQALNKVGISIKNSSGQMKTMDNILDEMGSKWHTLETDQKMALAQTVAGVRQYTQLMTLMNNWDFFKENLMTAQNSTGTLDSQAAIFAESWQAASNQVRASWEGLWDSLINSESFISILDGFSSFINLIEKMVDGLGGAGGTLALFGGILGKVFTPQIAASATGIVSSIRQLSPRARESDNQLRREWIKSFYGWDESGGKRENKVIQDNIEKYAKESYERDKRRQYMSSQQLHYDSLLEKRIDEAREKQRYGASLLDYNLSAMSDYKDAESNKEIVEFLKKPYVNESANKATTAYEDYLRNNESLFKNANFDMDKVSWGQFIDYLYGQGKTYNEASEEWNKFESLREKAKNTPTTLIPNLPKGVKSNDAMIKYAAREAAKFKEGFTKEFWDSATKDDSGNLKINYGAIKDKILTGTAGTLLDAGDIDKTFEDINKLDTSEKRVKKIRSYVDSIAKTGMSKVIDSMDGLTQEQRENLKKVYGVNVQGAIDGARGYVSGKKAEEDNTKRRDRLDKESKTKERVEGAVSLAQAASFLVAAGNSAKTLVSSFDDLSKGTGSFGNVLSSLTSTMTSLAFGVSGLSTGLSKLGLESASKFSIVIGLVVGLISGAIGLYEQHIDNSNELNKETIKATETEKEKTKANKELIDSVDKTIITYKNAQQDYKDSKISKLEMENTKTAVIESVQALVKNTGASGLSAAALSGDIEKVQELEYDNRENELKNLRIELEKAQSASKALVERNKKINGVERVFNPFTGQMQLMMEASPMAGLFEKEKDNEAKQIIAQYGIRRQLQGSNLWSSFGMIQDENVPGELLAFNNYDVTTAEGLVEIYDEFNQLMNELTVAGIDANNSGYYGHLQEFVDANRENIEKYKLYQEDIKKLDIEQKAINLEFYKVDNVADFQKKRLELIEQMTKDLNPNSEEYRKMVKLIDGYIGVLPNVTGSKIGNLATISSGIEDLYDSYSQTGNSISKEDFSEYMIDLYEKYGNLIFSLKFDVDFGGEKDLSSLVNSQLDSLISDSNILTIDVALNTKKTMEDTGLSGTIEEWKVINKSIQDEKFTDTMGQQITAWSKILKDSPYSDFVDSSGGINLTKFLTVPQETFKAALQFYTTELEKQKYGVGGELSNSITSKQKQVDDLTAQTKSMQSNVDLILSGIENYKLKVLSEDPGQVVKTLVSGVFNLIKGEPLDTSGAYEDVSLFDEEINKDQYSGIFTQNLDTLQNFLSAIKSKNSENLGTLKQTLTEAGFNTEFLSTLETAMFADNTVAQEYVDALLSRILAIITYNNNQSTIGSLTDDITNAQGDMADWQNTRGLAQTRRTLNYKGLSIEEVNELGAQILAQNLDYDFDQSAITTPSARAKAKDPDFRESVKDEINWDLYKDSNGNISEEVVDYLYELEALKKDPLSALPRESFQETKENFIESSQQRAINELQTKEGIEELEKSYDDLSQALVKNKKRSAEWNAAMIQIKKSTAKILNIDDWNSISDAFIESADAAGLLKRAAEGDEKAIGDLREQSVLLSKALEEGLIDEKSLEGKSFDQISESVKDAFSSNEELAQWATDLNTVMDSIEAVDVGELITGDEAFMNKLGSVLTEMGAFEGSMEDMFAKCAELGITPEIIGPFTSYSDAVMAGFSGSQILQGDLEGNYTVANKVQPDDTSAQGKGTFYGVRYRKNSSGGGGGSSGGGGGGGGKEPKKVAQTRRSQVVKRYKNIDAKRSINKNRQSNMSKKTDKLYGESRITNLQKENKLLEEGLRLNEKKAEEALKNLKIDEESLRKMTKKYGYELELDSEGNITNYEEILGDIYDQLHALEADGEISEEEEKVKERLDIMREEIEGAMEDWEDTIKQLEDLNNEYEETIDEMHSNELEQITYKLEFELELNELDSEWYDFLNEQIGDDFTQAVDTMDLITEKIKIANDNINLYKQSVTDLMENIENDPNRSLITGYLEDGVLTDEEAEILKEAYSGIIEQLSVLAEAKTSAEELLVSIFEGYRERIDFDTTALEHYTSLLEHFGNVVDIVGQKQLGLSDQFMENMAKMRIQQSRDIMSAAQSELAAYEQIRAEAEEELARAREEGRTNDIDYWQQQLDSANTSIQEARDKLVTSFENNLNAIADAFDKAVERIIQTFNDAVYAFGGLEGLSQDYSFIRENTELMAQDYEKIYELSKLNRNINKTLNDNNIIAGKQKMIELQKEINDLQANGAELSKYDLEYLQAKYELRLAEIELENAQNAKETVRLSKDSEGNWSYVYTASTEKIDEAQQKYEDALYKMQNLSYEYIDEMSEKIISASQAMMEEIQNLNKNNFENEQEYLAEINRIKAKYAESLGMTEEELNKALVNNEELYDKDWQSYSNKTGYAISESQNWIDRYAESTLGTLMKSTSDVADYMNNFALALDELTNSLYRVAGDYYNGIDDAFAVAGITKEDFASFVTTNTKAIMNASTNTKKDIETQTSILVKEYSIQADKVTDIQRTLDTAIDIYGPYIREIRDLLKESAALTKEQQGKDATYTYQQAGELFNSMYGDKYKIEMNEDGVWTKQVEGVKRDILKMHSDATTDEEKRYFADMYTWLTSYILPYVTSLDTGGYTGEWGTSGRLAMLHEKELILNANDTANFLDALNVSKELVNRVIEMNARASSFGIGGLSPSSIQDFAQNLEQQVTITAEFPNAVDHNEIEEAFASLINTASQYANRK